MCKRILIADDDPVIRVLVGEFLKVNGYDAILVETGGACLAELEAGLPDLLLLDLMMPDMTGIDVLVKVRENPQLSQLPVVMLSAHEDSDTFVTAQGSARPDAYLTKPFDLRHMIDTVSRLVRT
jgi:DNA-binding response OmpR family regulator